MIAPLVKSAAPVIRRLPNTLINQIAAGEVVERPAACAKELIENALDAGATEIEVRFRNGGLAALSVIDNGYGMDASELQLAIERHATSKLTDDDLSAIRSFGFRGEALPSIASVSRLTLTSRKAGASEAWQVNVEGGVAQPVQPASLPFGTRVDVRDLFFATPARLKFMKTARTESAHIWDVVERLALANPAVAFRTVEEGGRQLHYAAGDGLQRLAAVMGAEFARNALPLNVERDNLRLAGWVSVPTDHRATAAEQYLFVNGRPVRDRLLLAAVRAGYGDQLPYGRHPQLALFLTVPLDEVDVNVHPAKSEVRFTDAAKVRSLLVGGISHTIRSQHLQSDQSLTAASIKQWRPLQAYTGQGQTLSLTAAERSFVGHNNFASEGPSFADANFAAPQARQENADMTAQHYPLGAAVAQIHHTYIVAQTAKGLVLVDQHAAHERIVYEQLKQNLHNKSPLTQALLLPEVIELDAASVARLLAEAEHLSHLGLSLESFGDKAVLVREVPALLAKISIKDLVRDIASQLAQHEAQSILHERILQVCATSACHGSVRAGREMNLAEMNALLRQIEQTPGAGQCNHGRPTFIELPLNALESLFARR